MRILMFWAAVFLCLLAMVPQSCAQPAPQPLMRITFDIENVEYGEALRATLEEVKAYYPQARFSIIAAYPPAANAAADILQSTHARRNAERVLRDMTEMGADPQLVEMSFSPDPTLGSNEVHLFLIPPQ